MKDLGEGSHVIGIKLLRDRLKRMLAPRHLISMRFLLDSACKISRKDSFLLELEVLY